MDKHDKKSIDDTTQLHEIYFVAISVPTCQPRKWPLRISNLPCNCVHCNVNPNNERCIYAEWCCTCNYDVQIKSLQPEEAQSWVNSRVARKVKGGQVCRTITEYHPDSEMGIVLNDNGTSKAYNYAKLSAMRIAYGGVEAESFVGTHVAREIDGALNYGSVLMYDPNEMNWIVEFGNGDDIKTYSYSDLIPAK